MRKTLLLLVPTVAGLVVAALVVSLRAGPNTEQPAAAAVVGPGGSAGPATEQPAAAAVLVPGGPTGPASSPSVSLQIQLQDNPFASLTPEEIARAQSMVANDRRVVEHTKGHRHAVLMVQRYNQEDKTNLQERRAEVFIYVYPSGRSLYALANLRTNAVDRVEVRPGAQPSITPEETTWALNIALADAEAGALIREQHQQATGSPLLRADQLRVSIAGVFSYAMRHHPFPIPRASACGVQRCVSLHLEIPNGPLITAVPIVNLTTERVVYAGHPVVVPDEPAVASEQ